MIAYTKIGRRVTWSVPFLIFTLELPGDLLVPFHHFRVRFSRESFPGDHFRENAAIWVRNIPLADCILQVLGMLIGAQE